MMTNLYIYDLIHILTTTVTVQMPRSHKYFKKYMYINPNAEQISGIHVLHVVSKTII